MDEVDDELEDVDDPPGLPVDALAADSFDEPVEPLEPSPDDDGVVVEDAEVFPEPRESVR